MRDIAAQAGVSIATVSRALNGHASVAPHTRELVERVADRLGVRDTEPNVRQDAVYVRCPYVLTDYFGTIVSAIAETLELHGRTVVLNAGEAAQRTDVLATLPSREDVGGAIVILPQESGEQLADLRASGFPFVVVDPRTPVGRDIAAVSAAHFTGARSMANHLIQLGHRRMGVLGGPGDWLASQGRLAGHASALAEIGVLPTGELIRVGEATVDFGEHAAGELLDLPDRPTAIVAFNDKMAVGALTAAVRRGIRVPEDLSIAGFDDIDLARATRPMLTTVRQPLQEMGRMAVSLLIRLLSHHQLDALHVELATELVVRGSTGPA